MSFYRSRHMFSDTIELMRDEFIPTYVGTMAFNILLMLIGTLLGIQQVLDDPIAWITGAHYSSYIWKIGMGANIMAVIILSVIGIICFQIEAWKRFVANRRHIKELENRQISWAITDISND